MITLSKYAEDLTDKTFNYLTARFPVGRKGRSFIWRCNCKCGQISDVASASLKSGGIKSCGCYNIEQLKKRLTTHGLTKHPLYHIWNGIIDRCTNKNSKDYYKYGARGITVCESWIDINVFVRDMGQRPTKQHSIDRIDNNGPYSKENCRWATKSEQNYNKRDTVYLEYQGQKHTIKEWSEITGLSVGIIRSRRCLKWSDERILSTPRLIERF